MSTKHGDPVPSHKHMNYSECDVEDERQSACIYLSSDDESFANRQSPTADDEFEAKPTFLASDAEDPPSDEEIPILCAQSPSESCLDSGGGPSFLETSDVSQNDDADAIRFLDSDDGGCFVDEAAAVTPAPTTQRRCRPRRSCPRRGRRRRCDGSESGDNDKDYLPSSGVAASAPAAARPAARARRSAATAQAAAPPDATLKPPPASSSTTSSSSDDERIRTAQNDLKQEARFERRKLRSLQRGRKSLMPTNMSEKDLNSATMSVRQKLRKAASSCADIDPMEVDSTVGFTDIGGLTQHIQALKEVVVFPLLYPELFQRFDVTPPKGVLFYGPPGTGKTLVARALANECSRGDQKVAFFMRKGADCLSKWVGESERQLRLLFDQAYSMRPSIIFFDEIDGLAPVRSSRQDQIHSSIVSTLLALMDGLDKRGEIIVIGATNRLDSIDPALRRPGRFDREMRFDLPDKTARESILGIHTKSWNECRPSEETFKWLAAKTSGYCGADLRSLCTEAVLIALRERFPHIYLSAEKLQIDPASVKIEKRHFADSMRLIVPAARRDFAVISHQMNPRLACFVEPVVAEIMRKLPQGYVQRRSVDNLWGSELQRVVMALKVPPSVPAGRLILHGDGFLGQTTHFLPVLINQLDHLPVFSLSCEQIFAQGHAEENIAQVVRSALRATSQGTPVVLLMPDVDVLELTLPSTTWSMLISSLNAFNGFTSALVIASVQHHYQNCSKDIIRVFRFQDSFEILPPDEGQRIAYFKNIFDACLESPVVFDASQFPQPPKASKEVPVRKVSREEYKELKLLYGQMHRQFRIFLRDVLGRLVRDRRFNLFNLPVDKEDAEDYYDIIKSPMCLSQMMEKIDHQAYTKKSEFLADIRLIMKNALEYNSNRSMEEKTIRHNAIALVDMAEAMFGSEFDDDRLCEKIEQTARLLEEAKKSIAGGDTANSSATNAVNGGDSQLPPPPFSSSAGALKQTRFVDFVNASANAEGNGGGLNRNRKHRRLRGYSFTPIKRRLSSTIVKKYKTFRPSVSTPTKKNGAISSSPLSRTSSFGSFSNNSKPAVNLNVTELENALNLVVCKTSGWSIPDIECLGAQLAQCIESRRDDWERVQLPAQLSAIIDAFQL